MNAVTDHTEYIKNTGKVTLTVIFQDKDGTMVVIASKQLLDLSILNQEWDVERGNNTNGAFYDSNGNNTSIALDTTTK